MSLKVNGDQLRQIVPRDVIIGAALRRLRVSLRPQSVGHDGTLRRRNLIAWSRRILNIRHFGTLRNVFASQCVPLSLYIRWHDIF